MRSVFIIVVSLLLVVTLEGLYYASRALMQRRVDELKRRLTHLPGAVESGSLLRQGRLATNAALAELLARSPLALKAEASLESADAPITVAQLWGSSLGLAFAAGVISAAARLGLVLGLMAALAGAGLPFILLALAKRRRASKISEQLPEALDMMSRSLRAGHATSAALQLVAQELPAPISVEFGRAFEEQRLGLPLEEAILHMTERSPTNLDLKIFSTSTTIQRETGGNLAELLSGLAETIRARYRFRGKVRSLTAEGRMSATVLSIVPVGFVLALSVMSPGYLDPLLSDPRGKLVLIYAVVSWLSGVLWLTKMTHVEY
jgi:tight adherence protein B